MVLQDVAATTPARTSAALPQILVLSARNDDLLQQTAQRYLDFIEAEQPDLIHLCFTAAHGREQHDVRVAIIVESLEQAKDALQSVLKGNVKNAADSNIITLSQVEQGNEDTPSGSKLDKRVKALTDAFNPTKASFYELTAIATHFVKGARVNWLALFEEADHKRVHLPPQPFKSDIFWLLPKKRASVAAITQPDTDETAEIVLEITGKSARIKGVVQDDSIAGLAGKFVAYVIAETLGYDNLTVDSDYYALGGDSIIGTKITHILGDLLSIDVQPNDLLAASNLGAFVTHVIDIITNTPHAVDALQKKQPQFISAPEATKASNQISISALPEQAHYPLSRAQQRMYVLAGLAPKSTAYNVNAIVEIDELPDLAATEVMFNQLIARHDSLRTGFKMDGETPVQVVAPHASITLSHQKLQGDSNDNSSNAVQRWASEFIQPFDLAAPPLMRLGFASNADNTRHYLILDMHHIITDGTSMGVLIAEYLQLVAGQPLSQLPLQYRDFAHWHNQQMDSLEQKHQAYWLDRFSEEVPEAQLPLDYPRPALQQFSGHKVQSLLSHELLSRCKAFAASEGVSLFMLMSGVFRVLMAKYQVANDLVLGTPVAGRNRREWQSMIGMFVNTVALRFKLDQTQSFSTMLSELKQQTLTDFAHQDYPFELLPEQLNIPRNTAKNPLFDIYFVLQNEDMGLDGDGVKMLPVDTGIARFDLTVICRELKNQAAEHGMTIDWEYATSLFDANTIERMAVHFEQVLEQLLEQLSHESQAAISTVSCLTAPEYEQIITGFNQTTTDYQAEVPLQVLFEQQAAKHGDKTAVQFVTQGDQIQQQLTYSQLNCRANQLADALSQSGVAPTDVVVLYLPRNIDTVVAMLAVLKAGATYVPLDAANPVDRNQGIIADSQAVLLLTDDSMPALDLTLLPGNISRLSLNKVEFEQFDSENRPAQNDGNSLIYLMYTSGTTGKPKGAKIRHKSVNRVVRNTNYIALDENDTCLLVSSFAFDGCVLDIYGALLNGGKLLIVSKDDTLNPKTLGQVITSQAVTSFFMTTSLFNIMVDNAVDALKGVKYAMFGGEAASTDHVIRACKAIGPGKLVNGYGPTESTVFAACFKINSSELPASLPIGPAIANTRIYILDEWMKPVPTGVAGEIYLGGDGIADGYLNREELTAERFLPSPFVSGDTLYRTGDLGRFDHEGCISYMGRIDFQVKIRGFRIEPDEVKSAILQQPGILDCIVTADPDQTGTRQLLSWIVPEDDKSFDQQLMLEQLNQQLPDYMIPRAFTVIQTLPLTNNGKLDKSQLPAPVLNNEQQVAARNDIEQTMLDVWQDILQNSEIGITDNFFAIGGDSIKGIQVVARLQEHGITIDTATLFQHQNIETLAKHTSTNDDASSVSQEACTGELTLNPIQHWFMDSVKQQALTPDAFNHFNQAMWIALDSPISEEKLSNALQRLTDHHDMLRVAFSLDSSKKTPPALFGIEGHQAFSIDSCEVEETALTHPAVQQFAQTLQQHINIEQAIHISAGLLSTNDGSQDAQAPQVLILAIHHLVVDVISWSVLLNDLMMLIDSAEDSNKIILPAKTISQQDWNAQLAIHADSEKVQANKDYWLAMAGENWTFPALNKPAGKVAGAQIISKSLDKSVTKQLLNDANNAFTTEPQHLLVSALTIATDQWAGAGKRLINLENHGRDPLPDTQEPGRTVGWFTSTSPFILENPNQNSENHAVGELIKEVKERLRRVPGAGRDYGLLRWLSTQTSEADKQQLDKLQPHIGFNYLGKISGMDEDGNQQVQPLDRSLTTSAEFEQTLPLDLVLFVKDEQLTLELMYDSQRINSQQADALLDEYNQALQLVTGFCTGQQHSEKTATDFTVTELEQDEFDDILDDIF